MERNLLLFYNKLQTLHTKDKIRTLVANRLKFAVAQYYNTQVTPEIIDSVYDSMRGSTSAVNAEKIAENKFKTIAPKKLAAFTTAIVSIAKSGGASELLNLGSKVALGGGIGAGLEILFPNEAQAAELFTKDEQSDLAIAGKFGGIESLQKKEEELMKQKELENLKRKEGQFDIYEEAGIPTFPEYFFSLGKAELDMKDL